jgi:hypothetical protein
MSTAPQTVSVMSLLIGATFSAAHPFGGTCAIRVETPSIEAQEVRKSTDHLRTQHHEHRQAPRHAEHDPRSFSRVTASTTYTLDQLRAAPDMWELHGTTTSEFATAFAQNRAGAFPARPFQPSHR